MTTKLRPISHAEARQHFNAGRTVHAVSPKHPAVHHMAHKMMKTGTNPSFEEAHNNMRDTMKARTGSPDVQYHIDDHMNAASSTPDESESMDTSSMETPDMDMGGSANGQ